MEPADVDRAERLLRRAQQAAGLAAYEYFFREPTPSARATYIAAMEAESEAEALVEAIRGDDH